MCYVFGDCVLDTQCYLLLRAGQPIRLRPKVFQVLVYLLTHRERVVAMQELSAQVWHGRFISDTTLESTPAAARRVLGGRGPDHRYIHTRHGYGYRFVAPVEEHIDPLRDRWATLVDLPLKPLRFPIVMARRRQQSPPRLQRWESGQPVFRWRARPTRREHPKRDLHRHSCP